MTFEISISDVLKNIVVTFEISMVDRGKNTVVMWQGGRDVWRWTVHRFTFEDGSAHTRGVGRRCLRIRVGETGGERLLPGLGGNAAEMVLDGVRKCRARDELRRNGRQQKRRDRMGHAHRSVGWRWKKRRRTREDAPRTAPEDRPRKDLVGRVSEPVHQRRQPRLSENRGPSRTKTKGKTSNCWRGRCDATGGGCHLHVHATTTSCSMGQQGQVALGRRTWQHGSTPIPTTQTWRQNRGPKHTIRGRTWRRCRF